MAPLTDESPKPMLDVGGAPLIERILQAAIDGCEGEIVVVAGYRPEPIERLIRRRFERRVHLIHNHHFDVDRNIFSVELGVNTLKHPERGYTIVEADLLMECRAWRAVFNATRQGSSFWVTRGRYGPNLTGGIVHVDANGWVDAIEYRPRYEPAYDGWSKMVGILSVGPGEVGVDRVLRRKFVSEALDNYYLAPWAEARSQLPCRILDLGTHFARSFNTPFEFERAVADYLALRTADGRAAIP